MVGLCIKGLAFAVLGAAAASSPGECAAAGQCNSAPSLVQKHSIVEHAVSQKNAVWKGSNCRRQFPSSKSHPAACIVMRGDRAMLVRVPYGRRPGWDFPGGLHDRGEAPCETAEREVCEETGYSVSAYGKISSHVYLCKITGSNVCTKAKDEGFLQTKFFSKGEIYGLRMRGGTWGDKRKLLLDQFNKLGNVGSPSPAAPSGAPDACGCRPGENGWSSTRNRCSSSSETDPKEAIACQSRNNSPDFDVCGCRRGEKGWSTTRGRCSSSSQTSSQEENECRSMR